MSTKVDGTALALALILDPIRDQDRSHLRKVAKRLKQTDGECWAVGEMLERACRLLDMIEPEDGWDDPQTSA